MPPFLSAVSTGNRIRRVEKMSRKEDICRQRRLNHYNNKVGSGGGGGGWDQSYIVHLKKENE